MRTLAMGLGPRTGVSLISGTRFDDITAQRLALARSLDPIQYLRFLESGGVNQVRDSSVYGDRTGIYNATDKNLMQGKTQHLYGLGADFNPANLAWIDNYTPTLGSVINPLEGSAFLLVKLNPLAWADGLQHWFWQMRASATYYLALMKWSTTNQLRARRYANATDLSVSFLHKTNNWFTMGMTWSESLGVVKLYIDGIQVGTDGLITTPWSGTVNLSRIGRDMGSGTLYHDGSLGEFALFNRALGADEHLQMAGEYGNHVFFLGLGDSKTAANVYQHTTKAALDLRGERWDWRNIAVSGQTVATAKLVIDDALAIQPTNYTPRYVFANFGANDVNAALPSEAQWKSDYQYMFDAIKFKWPLTKIYIMRPWRRNEMADCNTLSGWIDSLVAANPGFCFLGPDERVFLENGDDGVTYTSEGVHPNTAGYELTGTQWASIVP